MSDNQKNLNQTNEPDGGGNVDQIREILFGSQTREVNQRFEKLESDIKRSFDELKSKIEQNQKDLKNELSEIKENALKQEKRLQHNIDLLNEELNTKHEQLYKEQLDNKNSLTENMNLLKLEILEILELKLSQMNNIKLSKDDAANIMIEAANKIKGNIVEKEANSVTKKSKD